jgi:hypothetical protein
MVDKTVHPGWTFCRSRFSMRSSRCFAGELRIALFNAAIADALENRTKLSMLLAPTFRLNERKRLKCRAK